MTEINFKINDRVRCIKLLDCDSKALLNKIGTVKRIRDDGLITVEMDDKLGNPRFNDLCKKIMEYYLVVINSKKYLLNLRLSSIHKVELLQ